MNARLRARAAKNRPHLRELRRSLAQAEREIANHALAIGRGDFASLETALTAAERRRGALQAELTRRPLEGAPTNHAHPSEKCKHDQA